jgi:hypothetical protein
MDQAFKFLDFRLSQIRKIQQRSAKKSKKKKGEGKGKEEPKGAGAEQQEASDTRGRGGQAGKVSLPDLSEAV